MVLWYPLLDEFECCQGVKIAGFRDIAAMKLVALVQRGTKKDFIDLYCLEKEKFRLEEMISLVEKKFEVPNYQTLIIKAWGYFVDAEQEATPQMFWDISWEEIKAHFLKRQRQFVDYYFNR
jgi:predicted nucleotidyltransferase component of viral defense system